MRDGMVLAADVYRPHGDGRHPVLLQRTPYDKSLTAVIGLIADPLRSLPAGTPSSSGHARTRRVRRRFPSLSRRDRGRRRTS
jgi:predicted acyl esterase